MSSLTMKRSQVQRRIGGLETRTVGVSLRHAVQRRIGGLVVLLNKLKN